MKVACSYCGENLPVQSLQGTQIRIEGNCRNEWCPNPDQVTRKNRETLGSLVAVLGIFVIMAGVIGWYFVLGGWEDSMGRECRDRGGSWAPVRGIVGLPTGTGACIESSE